MDKEAETPKSLGSNIGSDPANSNNFLAINNLHYHANDISELRKLAEIDASLAEKIIDQRDRESARIAASYRFGLFMSSFLMATVIASFTLIVIYGGILTASAVIVAVLATALLVRVVLTGQWSETSWFGRLTDFCLRLLGGTPTAPR